MAKNQVITVIVPDNFYRVLYQSRFDNDNCKAVIVSKDSPDKDPKKRLSVDCLTFDTGIETIYVVPESSKAKFEEIYKD